jgi:uncharacterized membrane protein YidH (DUF202 family)
MRESAFERTQLAWQRYALGVAVIAILSLRAGLAGEHDIVAFALAFALGATAAVLQLLGPRIDSRTAIRLALAASLLAAAGSLLLALL